MNRRTLILAGFAMFPVAAPPDPAGAQRRPGRSRERGAAPTARRQRRGGLTASNVRTRIVSRTFTSTEPLNIPKDAAAPATPYPSLIPVRGLNQGRIVKVRVTLIGLSHLHPVHVDVLVAAPGTGGVILMSDAGGGTPVSGITLIFDQDAANSLPEPLVSGTFRPTNLQAAVDLFPAPAPSGETSQTLTLFNNRNPNGLWQLFVVNDGPYYGGSLAGWSVTIQARVRVPHRHRRRPRRRRQ